MYYRRSVVVSKAAYRSYNSYTVTDGVRRFGWRLKPPKDDTSLSFLRAFDPLYVAHIASAYVAVLQRAIASARQW
jgi:hypothetical protein